MAQRGVAAGARLGIELGDRRRVLLALDLDVGVLGRGRAKLFELVLFDSVVLGCHRPLSL